MNNFIKNHFSARCVVPCLIMLIGGLMGGPRGVEFAFFISLIMNFFSYWFSDKMVLKAYKR